MKHLKTTFGILLLTVLTMSITSCKGEKKEQVKNTENHATKKHDNSDGHHDAKYACSMHPEITGKKGDKCSKCGMNLTEMKGKMKMNMGDNTKGVVQKNAATSLIIDAYIQIKNGLVADNKKAAANGGTAMVAAFSKFDMSKLSGDAHKEYMEIMESAKEHAAHIVKSDIAHQREHFEVLSTDINDLISLIGTDKTLYRDFCPMANNNKGAYWLSEVKEIKNPYFGAKMMKCGSVKKQIN